MRSLLGFLTILFISIAQSADCDGVTCGSGANAFVDNSIITSLENLGIKVNAPTATRQTLPEESQQQKQDTFAQDESQDPVTGGGGGGSGGGGSGNPSGSGIETTTPDISGSTPQIGRFDSPDFSDDQNDSISNLGQDSFDTLQPIIDPQSPEESDAQSASADRAMRLGNLVYSGGQQPELSLGGSSPTRSDTEKAAFQKGSKQGDEYFGDLGGGGGGSRSFSRGSSRFGRETGRKGRKLASLKAKERNLKNMFDGKLNYNQRSIASYQGSIFGLMCNHYNHYTKKHGFKDRKTNCPDN